MAKEKLFFEYRPKTIELTARWNGNKQYLSPFAKTSTTIESAKIEIQQCSTGACTNQLMNRVLSMNDHRVGIPKWKLNLFPVEVVFRREA